MKYFQKGWNMLHIIANNKDIDMMTVLIENKFVNSDLLMSEDEAKCTVL